MNERKKYWEFKTHVILSVIITLLSIVTDLVATGGTSVYLLSMYKFFIEAKDSASAIGIIGGADGPTAIFMSGNPIGLFIIAKVFLLLLLLLMYFPTRKFMNKRYFK